MIVSNNNASITDVRYFAMGKYNGTHYLSVFVPAPTDLKMIENFREKSGAEKIQISPSKINENEVNITYKYSQIPVIIIQNN